MNSGGELQGDARAVAERIQKYRDSSAKGSWLRVATIEVQGGVLVLSKFWWTAIAAQVELRSGEVLG